MAFKHKFTYEEKVKIVSEYIDGTYGFREICKRYDINQGSLKDWKRLYETFGWSGLKTGSKTTRYSKETKEAAVRDYLSHEFTFPEILKKYQIRSGTQLKKWIKKYNGCEVLKSSGTGGNNIMTTGRKTTFDERIEIVQYCIAHDHNYAETAEEYQVSTYHDLLCQRTFPSQCLQSSHYHHSSYQVLLGLLAVHIYSV